MKQREKKIQKKQEETKKEKEQEEKEKENKNCKYVTKDPLRFDTITKDSVSQWFNATKVYFLLTDTSPSQVSRGLHSMLSSIWDPG